MKKLLIHLSILSLLAAVALPMISCAPQEEGAMEESAEEMGESMEEGAEEAGDMMDEGAEEGAEEAGDMMDEGMEGEGDGDMMDEGMEGEGEMMDEEGSDDEGGES